MSLEALQKLLLNHKISPNKILGQNFMIEPAFYPKLAQYATLSQSDMVLDVGAGFGFLTRFLSDKCRAVVAVEKDTEVAAVLREQLKILSNVTVIEGNVLKVKLPPFNKVIAIPPYYLSSQLVMLLLEWCVDCAVMILQREFCDRLVAKVSSEEYGWLTVVTQHQAEAKLLDPVPKDAFYPPPEVDSVILSLKPWAIKPFEVKNEATFIQLTKWLFTQRNKKLAKAIVPYIRIHFKLNKQDADALVATLPFHDKRARELTPQDFGAIANALPN
jgi:16S rRNA (adenine1518-N6/adenine1519-N6)-dimethyltransferase